MLSDGTYFQEVGESKGRIAEEVTGELKRPYFYSVFILDGYTKVFNDLTPEELKDTYRYQAMTKALTNIKK